MRMLLPALALIGALVAAPVAGAAQAQGTKPKPKPAGKAAPAPPSRALVLTVQVTNRGGQVLDGVKVSVSGALDRDGMTDAGGLARLSGMKAGDYRVRVEKEGLITLEREVTIRPGQSIAIDMTMNEAPAPPPAPEPAPAPKAMPQGAPGEPRTLSLEDYIEKNLIAREPMKQSSLACSGVLRTVLLQIREPLAEQTDDQLDQTLYVVAGQGTIRLAGKDSGLGPASFAVIPRGTPFGLSRRGNTPLIVLLSRANEPCGGEAAAAAAKK